MSGNNIVNGATGANGGAIVIPARPSAIVNVDYSTFVQAAKDRGTYRLATNALVGGVGTVNYDEGVLWSNNFRHSFLRFRSLNVAPCNQIVQNGQVEITEYMGNDTITVLLPPK
jgi:hypothetical protein